MAKISPYNPHNYPSEYTHYKDCKGDFKLQESLPWQDVIRISKLQKGQVVKLTHRGEPPINKEN